MAYLVALDFDTYPYTLPKLDRVPNLFSQFVDYKEKEALISLLGQSFYDTLVSGIAAETQIYEDIRDGVDYTFEDVTYRFNGLKDILKPYIYSEWIRENRDQFTGDAVVSPVIENSLIKSYRLRVVESYNHFVDALGFYDIKDISQKNTLYGLLKSNVEYVGYEYNRFAHKTIFDV